MTARDRRVEFRARRLPGAVGAEDEGIPVEPTALHVHPGGRAFALGEAQGGGLAAPLLRAPSTGVGYAHERHGLAVVHLHRGAAVHGGVTVALVGARVPQPHMVIAIRRDGDLPPQRGACRVEHARRPAEGALRLLGLALEDDDVARVGVVVAALLGHVERADGGGVGRPHEQDVVLDAVADALGVDGLVAAGASHAVDDVVGHREVVGGVVEVHAALDGELVVACVVDEVVVVHVVAPRPPAFQGAGVLAVEVGVVDVIVGDEVVAGVEEVVAVLPRHALDGRAERLVSQALDGGGVARHVVDVVVHHAAVAALPKPHAVAMAEEPATVVDVVVLDDVVVVDGRLVVTAARQRHAMMSVEADKIAVESDALAGPGQHCAALAAVLDRGEANRAVRSILELHHVAPRDAEVKAAEVQVADERLAPALHAEHLVGRGRHDVPLRDGLLAGPTVERPLIEADDALAGAVENLEHILHEVAVARLDGVATVAFEVHDPLRRIDPRNRFAGREPVVGGPQEHAAFLPLPVLRPQVARSIDKRGLRLALDGGFEAVVALVRTACEREPSAVLEELIGLCALGDSGLAYLAVVLLPRDDPHAAQQHRHFAGIGCIGDGMLGRAGVLGAEHDPLRHVVRAATHQHGDIPRQPSLHYLAHGVPGALDGGEGAVGAVGVGLGKFPRPLVTAVGGHVEVGGGHRPRARPWHDGASCHKNDSKKQTVSHVCTSQGRLAGRLYPAAPIVEMSVC